MNASDPFICPTCGGTHFGSVSHRRADGSWVILERNCHDEHEVGCRTNVRLEPSDDNLMTEQDFLDAEQEMRKLSGFND